jgi:RNA-directed DNA polymerase
VSLIEEVVRRENMMAAYERVKQNSGAPGVDGITVERLWGHCEKHWATIRQQILAGEYRPQPVRRVDIPKPGGGTRMLGIPTAIDRMIQQALLQTLQPIFDPTFSEASFGFRPGRNALQAVERARQYVAEGRRWVVDIDLEKFFDRVNHDVLMARVARKIEDKEVLRLIRRYLQAGIMDGGIETPREEGTPQGGPLSPLLSNILLDELDKELEQRGHAFVRYADDCNIYVNTEAAGHRVMRSLDEWLWKRLRLRVNRDKSAVARPWERKFLGYSVTSQKDTRLRIAPVALERLKGKVRILCRSGRGKKFVETVEGLSALLRGWIAYFRLTNAVSVLKQLDSWVRRKLRSMVWRQWRHPANRARQLRERAHLEPKYAGWLAWKCPRGAWWHSDQRHMELALSLATLRRHRLVELAQEHKRLGVST